MIEVNNHYIFDDVEDILAELKRQLELNGVHRFYKTIRSGDNIQTCCPFHKDGQERKPSFGILIKDSGSNKAGQCHCFTCGWTGSLAEMISNCFGYDDWGVYGSKWLIRNFLSGEVENRQDVELDFSRGSGVVRNSVGLVNGVDNNAYVKAEELDKYRYTHPYMYQRGLTDEIIELFDIGYDSNSDCITFPVRDVSGNCLFVARRSVVTKFFHYPAGVEKPLYGLYEVLKFKYGGLSEVIVCESMLDALSFWTIGKYAVALNGLGNELQIKQLKQLPCRKIILATDMDEAGLKTRKRLKKLLTNKIVTEYIFPKGRKDANECTKDELMNLQEIF